MQEQNTEQNQVIKSSDNHNDLQQKDKEKAEELDKGFTEEMEGSSTEQKTDKDIDMKSCNSSNVYKHGFVSIDPEKETGILAVEFKGGSLYHYFKVPAFLYEEMCCADSVGKFINSKIKNNYEFKKVEKAHPIESV